MSVVKGSKQYRSVVVTERSGQGVARQLLLLLLMAVIAGGSYWFGGREMRQDFQNLSADYQRLQTELAEISVNYDDTRQQLTNATVGSEVDRQAVNDVRSIISKHKQTINALNEEISFYKGLMAPTEREQGLGIRSWELYSGSEPRRLQFKLVLQQLAVKHTVLKGAVTVDVVGKMAGEEKTLSLDVLSDQIDKRDMPLRFKYFQSIDGELLLPEGFEPNRVAIVARATSPKAVKVEKHYGWILQNSDV